METYKFLAKRHVGSLTPPVARTGAEFDDVINLSIGDPDIATPKVIIDEAFKDAYAGHTKYTDTRGYPELRRAIAGFYKKKIRYDRRRRGDICVHRRQCGNVSCNAGDSGPGGRSHTL